MSTMRVILSGVILAQRCQNVLHFWNPDDTQTHDNIRDELIANWLPIVRNVQNANWRWTEISVQRVSGTPDIATVYPLSGNAGSLSGAPAVTVIAILFSIRTAVPGRHGHGRFYLPGVHGESVSNSVPESGALSAFQGAANALVARYGASGTGPINLVVVPRATPSDTHFCTAIVVRPTFGVQRRRNIGVGG